MHADVSLVEPICLSLLDIPMPTSCSNIVEPTTQTQTQNMTQTDTLISMSDTDAYLTPGHTYSKECSCFIHITKKSSLNLFVLHTFHLQLLIHIGYTSCPVTVALHRSCFDFLGTRSHIVGHIHGNPSRVVFHTLCFSRFFKFS